MKTLKFKNEPYIIKNKGYSSIEISFIYSLEYNKDDIFNWQLIRQIVLNSSNKYKIETEFIKQKRKHTLINLSMPFMYEGDKQFIIFDLIVPDPKKIKSFDLEKAIEFFIETIYKPNIINNNFNQERFNREKAYLTKRFENENNNHNVKAINEFIDIFDNIGYLKENMYHNMPLIEKANSRELYNLYKNVVINQKPTIIIYGDVEEDISELIKKHIKANYHKTIIKVKKEKYYKPFKNQKNINKKSTDHQSYLFLGYKVNNMKKEYEDYLTILQNILNRGSNNLIHNTLRYEHNLLYYCNVAAYSSYGIIYINLAIENNKKEIALKATNDILESLKNKEILKECINKMIKDFDKKMKEQIDTKTYKLSIFIDKLFKRNSDKQFYNKLKKIDLDKYIDFLNHLENDTIYFKEGEYGD